MSTFTSVCGDGKSVSGIVAFCSSLGSRLEEDRTVPDGLRSDMDSGVSRRYGTSLLRLRNFAFCSASVDAIGE